MTDMSNSSPSIIFLLHFIQILAKIHFFMCPLIFKFVCAWRRRQGVVRATAPFQFVRLEFDTLYRFDFGKMVQVNTESKKTRHIRPEPMMPFRETAASFTFISSWRPSKMHIGNLIFTQN